MEELDILLPRHTLEEALGPELAKQARLRWGEECVYMPVSDGHRYLCSCGAVNPLGSACGQCGQKPVLLEKGQLEQLQEEADIRLAEEAEEAARQEQLRQQEARRLRKKKIMKGCLWMAAAFAAVAVALAAFWLITRVAIPESHYQKALSALEQGDLPLAHRQFMLAGDYRDAKAYLERFYTPYLTVRNAVGNTVTYAHYTYDDQGRLLTRETGIQTVDADGQLLDVGQPERYTQRYDENGNCVLQSDWYGHTVRVYNAQGDVVLEEYYRKDGQQETTRNFGYTYDDAGRVIEVAEICTEHLSVNYSYERREQYTYNAQGLEESRIVEVNYPAQLDDNYISHIRWRYNANGDPVEMVEERASIYPEGDTRRDQKTWVYDAQGRLLQSTDASSFSDDPGLDRTITVTNTYDKKGRLVLQLTQREFYGDPKRNSTDEENWKYDWEGKLVENSFQTTYPDAERQQHSGYSRSQTYRYDLLGRLVCYEYQWQNSGEGQRRKEVYTYDTDGMPQSLTFEEVWDDGRTSGQMLYDREGLVCWEQYIPESDPTDQISENEYTYAYFYFPEGHDMARQNINEVGAILYGA